MTIPDHTAVTEIDIREKGRTWKDINPLFFYAYQNAVVLSKTMSYVYLRLFGSEDARFI